MPDDVMTPEEFEQEMRSIFSDELDREGTHVAGDDLLCTVLRQLGYGSGVDIFADAEKWYA